jgi:hypothetical protein
MALDGLTAGTAGRTGSAPLDRANALLNLGGAYTATPRALLTGALSDFVDPWVLEPLTAYGLLEPAVLFDAFTTARLAHLLPPLDRLFAVVAYPRQPLPRGSLRGAVLARRALGEPGAGHAAFIAGPDACPADEAWQRGLRLESARPGLYALVVEAGSHPHGLAHRFARRVADADGRLSADTLILQPRLTPGGQRRGRGLAEDVDFDRAVRANQLYRAQLGWGARYADILSLLGLSAAASDQDFAQAAADWQSQHGLTSDGMLGPDSWDAMRPLLPSAPSPAPSPSPRPAPAPSAAIDVSHAVDANRKYAVQLGWAIRFDEIVALLGFNAMPTELQFAQAVGTWQGAHALPIDGMIGPTTWAAMQPLLATPAVPAPGPAPTRPAPAAVVAPFPTSPYAIALDRTNATMNAMMATLAADPTMSHLCAALVDLTDNPSKPPYAGFNDQDMLYVGSLQKISAMYAAFELRARVLQEITAEIGAGLSPGASGWEQPALAKLTAAWRPKLRAAFPALPDGFPVLSAILAFGRSNTVDIDAASPPLSDSDIDTIGEFGAPRGNYHDWMRAMLRWSNNAAAGRCIRPLSYPYINGALAGAGFFDATQHTGLWLSGDYEGHDWHPTNGAGQPLSPRWRTAQGRHASNFTGTAFQVARLMTLLATDRLVDAAASQAMRGLMTGADGIGSYVKAALDDDARAVTSVLSKIGYGDDERSHDCAIVERKAGGKTLRYVVVALGSTPRTRADLDRLILRLDNIILALHP